MSDAVTASGEHLSNAADDFRSVIADLVPLREDARRALDDVSSAAQSATIAFVTVGIVATVAMVLAAVAVMKRPG